jgi:hypothetical protein
MTIVDEDLTKLACESWQKRPGYSQLERLDDTAQAVAVRVRAEAAQEIASLRQMLSVSLLYVPSAEESQTWWSGKRSGEIGPIVGLWADVERYKINRAIAQEQPNG